jgi:uncharacterized protein HemX
MALIALLLAVCGLSCSVYLWLESRKKLSAEDVAPALSHASEELSKTYARSLREIETEWIDMYQKFSRLAGRVDKTRAVDAPQNATQALPVPGTRSDLVRRHRGGLPR